MAATDMLQERAAHLAQQRHQGRGAGAWAFCRKRQRQGVGEDDASSLLDDLDDLSGSEEAADSQVDAGDGYECDKV
jgi:hypothetical protein